MTKPIYITLILSMFYISACTTSEKNTINSATDTEPKTQITTKKTIKSVKTIVLGDYSSKKHRSILGTIESDEDSQIIADRSGTIKEVLVDIGDIVIKNQPLLTFEKNNKELEINKKNTKRNLDIAILSAKNSVYNAEINLENAQKNVKVTEISVQNTIKNAQVQLENAKKNLETTKISVGNTINNSQIQLNNSKKTQSQSRNTEKQNIYKTFQNLKTTANNSKNTVTILTDFIDRELGISRKYKHESISYRNNLGNKNAVLKGKTKDLTNYIIIASSNLIELKTRPSNNDIVHYAKVRLAYMKDAQKMGRWFEELIHYSTVSKTFSEIQRDGLKSKVQQLNSNINNNLIALENTIESANMILKNSQAKILQTENNVDLADSGVSLSISQAKAQLTASENAVNTAESTLNLTMAQTESNLISVNNEVSRSKATLILTKSQAESQIIAAQNQYNTALERFDDESRDIVILAPFSGIINDKQVVVQDFKNIGSPLFSLTNTNKEKKVKVFFSLDEYEYLKKSKNITVKFEGKKEIKILQTKFSAKLNPKTQKISVELILPNNEIVKNILIGSFVEVLLPLEENIYSIIPISAVSFEPSGAEVLVVNNDILERRVVVVGNMIGDSIEIIKGIKKGEELLKFRSHANSGEQITRE